MEISLSQLPQRRPRELFFKELFEKKARCKFSPRICFRCDEILQTSKFKKVHDFLQTYSEGKNINAEDRPTNIDKLGDIKVNIISLADHKKYYNFENSYKLIDNFLLNVKSKFVPSTKGSVRHVLFHLRISNQHLEKQVY